jgi:signal transduction histidine kinase/ligand-binding sensor domain-containing protein
MRSEHASAVRPMQFIQARGAAVLVAMLTATSPAAMLDVDTSPSVTVRNWDVDAGLLSPRVYAVAHTQDGYVWAATYAGLSRFDGVEFTTLTPVEEPALGSAIVTSLAVDASGMLWVGTEGGHLSTRGQRGFEPVVIPEIAGFRITAIRPQPDGSVWLACRGGVVRVAGTATRVYGEADGLLNAEIRDLVIDCEGTAWALAGGCLHRLEGDRWVKLQLEGLQWWDITAIATAAAGGVWCAEKAGHLPNGRASRVVRVTRDGRPASAEVGSWPINPERSLIDAIREDSAGRLWCATRGAGLHCRVAAGQWWTVGEGTSLARADGISFSVDPHADVWIGTRSNGIYQVGSVFVRVIRLPDQLQDYVVTSVAATNDGGMWAGTDGGGVVLWRDGKAEIFSLDQGLPSTRISALGTGDSNRLYAATEGGLAALEGGRFVSVALGRDPRRPGCECFFADGGNGLWVGTREATFHVDDTGARAIPRRDGQPLLAICFTRDSTGRLLALDRIGTLFEHVDGVFVELVVEAAEPFPGGRALVADQAGGVWIGSYGSGLARLVDGRLRRWSQQANGLPSSHVIALVETDGVVWAGSENGIYGCPVETFARSLDGEQMAVWRVTQPDGLPGKLCTARRQPAACTTPEGMIWMPNGGAVAGFRPADAMSPLPVFPPRVERAWADGVAVGLGAGGELTLPAGTRRLEFRVTSPNTVAPHRLAFRHRLVGFDDGWVGIEGRRVASYTGVPPGDYRLQVEVRGPNGFWQPMAENLAVRVPPRFWQRREVQAAAGVLVVCLVAGAVWIGERWRSQRRFEQIRIEQARDQERQRIARDIHDDIGSGLTEITMLSHLAVRRAGDGEAVESIQRIEDRARQLTRSMDEVVWAINPRNDSLEGFITYFHRWAQAFLSNAGLRVRWDLPLEPTEAPLAAEVRHQLLLACKEAVTNVVKHAGADEVCISCRPRATGLEILIQDDGRGFSPNESDTGRLGLGNLRARLAALGGSCELDSATGRGTSVRFVVTTDRQSAVTAGERE